MVIPFQTPFSRFEKKWQEVYNQSKVSKILWNVKLKLNLSLAILSANNILFLYLVSTKTHH